MKVLIIGGTGIISRKITQYLLEGGHNVTHFNRGIMDAPNLSVEVVRGDRQDLPSFEKIVNGLGYFDCVIDMICFTKVEAVSAVKAFKGKTGHYIFCSTVDVYSKTDQIFPISETAPLNPSSVFEYATRKAECERVFWEADGKEFPVTVFRPAQTYGEGGTLVHTLGFSSYLFTRILAGKPIIAHGDGNSLWSACYSGDVARAFANAAGNSIAFGKAYNVTANQWMTWNEYYNGIAQAVGAKAPTLVHIPTDVLYSMAPTEAFWCKVNFQYNTLFDNSKAIVELDFKQTVSWQEGVKRTYNWLLERNMIESEETHGYYDSILNKWNTAISSI